MVREKGILLFNIQVGNMENFFSCRYEILLRTSSHEIANLRKKQGDNRHWRVGPSGIPVGYFIVWSRVKGPIDEANNKVQ